MRRTFPGVSFLLILFAALVPILFLASCSGEKLAGSLSASKPKIEIYDQKSGDKLLTSFYAGEEVRIDISGAQDYEYVELLGKNEGEWEQLQLLEKTAAVAFTFPDVEIQSLQVNFLDENKETLEMVWLGDFSRANPPLYHKETVQGNARYTPQQNKLRQFFALNYLLLLGLVFLFVWNKKPSNGLAAGASFLFGTGIYSLIFIFLLFLRIPANFMTVNIGYLIFILAAFFVNGKKIFVNKRKIISYLAVYALFTILSIVLVNNNTAIVGYDSYQYVSGGYAYGVKGEITEALAQVISRFGIFPMIIYTLQRFFEFDFLYAFQPMFALTGVAAFAWILFEEGRERKQDWKKSAALSLLGTGFLASCYFWVFQTFWLMGNIQVALFLLLGVYFGLKGEKDRGCLFLSYFMLFCMAACRLETPLQGLVLVVLIAGNISVTNKAKKVYMISYAVSILLWYAGQFTFIDFANENNDQVGASTALPVMLCSVLLLLYALLLDKKWVGWIQKNLNRIAFLGVNALLVMLFLLKPLHSLETVEIILQNLLTYGFWGIMWLMLFLLTAGNLLFYKKLQLTDLMVYVVVFTIIALGIIRNTPLRLGFGDSVNRMMLHVYPLLIYGIMQTVMPEKHPAGENGRK